jgi:hypothetical protein
MIEVKEYTNGFDGYPFYIAKATKINKIATGITKRNALHNLRNAIRCSLKIKNGGVVR